MPDSEGSRLATVEAVLNELRGDIADVKGEQNRTRDRLHSMEAAVQGLVLVQRERIEQQDATFQRLGVRLQRLGLVIAASALAVSIVALVVHFH